MGSFFKITQGIVAVSSTLDDGRHQIVALRAPGDCAGYLETDGRYAFRGDALTDVSACTFDRRKFDRFVQLHPDLATALAATLSTALKQAGENMMVMGQLQSTERVAHFLVEIATLYARRQVRMKPLTLHITRTGIAAYLGLRVETVSRSLTDLKKRGIIALVGNDSVVLHDIERLVEIGKVRGRRSSPRS